MPPRRTRLDPSLLHTLDDGLVRVKLLEMKEMHALQDFYAAKPFGKRASDRAGKRYASAVAATREAREKARKLALAAGVQLPPSA